MYHAIILMGADKVLREMEKNSGEVCNPLILTSKIMPEWIPRQAEEGKFVMTLPNVPPKYKQLIMISVAAALQNKQCTEYFIKVGAHMGLTSKEIGEAILVARFAMASTIFSSAEDGFSSLVEAEKK
jgi:alkylhydroperoxidase/carboxymuconolactone decarboxylase family protein YurZ